MPLSASQRLKLLKAISERLAFEEYPFVDVTLKHFHLPTSNQWSGSKDAYVLEMIEGGSDQILIELGQHVGFHLQDQPAQGVDPPFWRKDMFRLFVSHLAAERVQAAALQTALLEYGVSCFIAHNDIEPTQEWMTQIETALATCDALVALLHDNFHASHWTDQEIGFAMGRGVPAFAVRYGQDPYGFIGRFQAFNGNGKTAQTLATELFDAYRKNKQTQKRMAEVLMRLFEESGSFAAAKARVGYLEELEVWDQSFVGRIGAALNANGQISGSWSVPDRVKALIKKWS